MNVNIEAAMKMLSEQGHTTIHCCHIGQEWYHILEYHALVKPQEMQDLADGVYSFKELIELFGKCRLEDQGFL